MNGGSHLSPIAARSAHEYSSVVPYAALGGAIQASAGANYPPHLGGVPFTTAEGERRRLAWLVWEAGLGKEHLYRWAIGGGVCLDCTTRHVKISVPVRSKGPRRGVKHTALVSIPADRMTVGGQSWDMPKPPSKSGRVRHGWCISVTTANPWHDCHPLESAPPSERRLAQGWIPEGVVIPHISGESLDRLGAWFAPRGADEVIDDAFYGIADRLLRGDYTL